MVHLDDTLFIGEGRNRKCYIHPDDKSLCIKISSKKGARSSKRETNYFKRLHWYNKNLSMISDYQGDIDTDIGNGNIYELIRDSDGAISKNLKHYIELNDEKIDNQVIEQLEILRVYLVNEYILISDLGLDNVLLQKSSDNSLSIKVIDGIGDNNQVPFLEFVKPLGLKRSSKKWNQLKSLIASISPHIADNIKPLI